MFRSSAALIALLAAACGPQTPSRAASDAVVADADDAGAAWPLLLRHCLSAPDCDPMSDFGKGEGEASGYTGSVAWKVWSRDAVREGAEDYGAKILVSLFGVRGAGGKAGRPLTIDELPDNLGGQKAKRSALTVEYRIPSQSAEPYFLQFLSPYLTGLADGVDEARVEITGASGVLYSAVAAGMEPPPTPVNGRYTPPQSMVFYAARNIRDEPLPQLLAALAAGESLSLKMTGPDGETMLQDVLYADGFASSVALGAQAAVDPETATAIARRCARLAGEPDTFWRAANVTAGLLVCDPRLPEQRR